MNQCDHPVSELETELQRLQEIGHKAFSACWCATPPGTEPHDAQDQSQLAQISAIRDAVIDECIKALNDGDWNANDPCDELRRMKVSPPTSGDRTD